MSRTFIRRTVCAAPFRLGRSNCSMPTMQRSRGDRPFGQFGVDRPYCAKAQLKNAKADFRLTHFGGSNTNSCLSAPRPPLAPSRLSLHFPSHCRKRAVANPFHDRTSASPIMSEHPNSSQPFARMVTVSNNATADCCTATLNERLVVEQRGTEPNRCGQGAEHMPKPSDPYLLGRRAAIIL